VSGVAYQASSKTLSAQLSPFMYSGCIGLAIVAASGAVLLMQSLHGQKIALPSGSLWGWMGLAALAGGTIDIATFLMYRAGAPFTVARTLLGAATAVMVLLLGVAFFKEGIAWQQIVGVVFCVIGFTLMTLYRV
jgi:drug/metabolite transporter (DMT)-like permease